jgi:DNA-binding NtrC family response regulator
MEGSILVIDDEIDMQNLLKRSLEPELGCSIETASSGEEALHILANERFDLVLADIKMPGMDGLELLELIKRNEPDITVIMMTAYGSIDTAVLAMKNGAYDFITKPFDHDEMVLRLKKALERSTLLKENVRLQKEHQRNNMFQDLVGKSTRMKVVYETIQTVAKTDLTVFITGETGTGKDLTARAVHALSHRSRGPFVAVNCPTVPENILESELFGYKRGAFTHASQNRTGLFQAAHKGTIFLDEIGDISPTIQTKLLRVLQEKEIKPLGDTKSISIDVRIIASTNQNVDEKIKNGTFREDFFYRLNVLPIKLPSLREHPEDIPLIANHLLEKHCAELKRPLKKLSPELMQAFIARPWVGNVREMENVIIQGILFSAEDEIPLRDIDFTKILPEKPKISPSYSEVPYKEAKENTLQEFNFNYIGSLLAANSGNVTQAARSCGLERQALQQIMRRYRISADTFRKKMS